MILVLIIIFAIDCVAKLDVYGCNFLDMGSLCYVVNNEIKEKLYRLLFITNIICNICIEHINQTIIMDTVLPSNG